MATETPIINILTYQLPFKLANQIYNEYQNRMKEALFLIDRFKTYSSLRENKKTVELFLSLSIFHKRLIANFDGAVKFYGTVTKSEEADTITIGNYNLTFEEKNKLLAVIMHYNALLEKYSIPKNTMEYLETRDFLKSLISLKSLIEDGSLDTKH
ncbi:MAG: hypothetical protein KDE33_02770 [Bacteroidetes bacterium]|nr:hypothetical protein [Bacteroidota bacterium]